MREYILTRKERLVLKDYLEKGIKGNHYYVLIHRLRNSYKNLRKDMILIEKKKDKFLIYFSQLKYFI